MFSSDTITRPLLPPTLLFLGVEGTDDAAANAMNYFKWRHGFQYGRPFENMFLPLHGMQRVPDSMTCCSRLLFLSNSNKVEILDFEAGEKSIFTNGDAEHVWIKKLYASDRYLAAIVSPIYENTILYLVEVG